MPSDCITFQESGYFSNLIVDYLNQNSNLDSLYNFSPSIENYKLQIDLKRENYNHNNRKTLVETLKKQYDSISISEQTKRNIELLGKENTYTITTGHQLNLFTGPLYFIYKIVSTINTVKALQIKYPEFNFVPIYWMATEDHDFEEINYFTINDSKIKWKKESKGPVGRLSTEGLEDVYTELKSKIGLGTTADYLLHLFENAYLKHTNLADATRYLTNELFKEYGLVIVDADDKSLKNLFVPYIKNELLNQTSFEEVSKTNQLLKNYTIQVNPRAINFFYMENNLRERIVLENDTYKVLNTSIEFSKEEILNEIQNAPEKFSPNVILRPLYQEVLLPNLGYIGGGGEIAYWLQLKSNFEANNISFPILQLRNSALIATEKQVKKLDKLQLTWKEIFLPTDHLTSIKVKQLSTVSFNFDNQIAFLKEQFKVLENIAIQTDASFMGAVKAQETKQIKGLKNLEKRLLKAEKRKYSEELNQIVNLKNELFPNGNLQERVSNFSTFYDANFISICCAKFNPFVTEFILLIS